MGIETGTVVAGKVQIEDVSLPEGAIVAALTPDGAGEVLLDAEEEATLLEAIAEAARGQTNSRSELFARLVDKPAKQ